MKRIKLFLNRIRNSEFWFKLFKNVAVIFLGNTGTSALNFITMLIMLHIMGTTNYGFFVMAQQYMNIIDALINFQSWKGVIKFGSDALYAKDSNKLSATIKYGMIIDIASACIGLAISIIILPIVANYMHWNDYTVLLCQLFCLEIVFHIEGSSIGVLRLFDKFNLVSIEAFIIALVQMLFVGGFFLAGVKDTTIVAVIFIVFDIIGRIGLLIISLYEIQKRIRIKNVFRAKRDSLDDNFVSYTMWANIANTVDIPVGYFDIFIVSTLSIDLVSIYKVFKHIVSLASKLVMPISTAILPQLSGLISSGRKKEAYDKICTIRNYVILLILPLVVLSVVFGKPLFNVFLGKDFADNLIMFILMVIIYGFSFAYIAIHPYFAAIGKVKEDFYLNLGTNLIYVLFIFTTVKYWGVYAVLIGTGVQYFINISIKSIMIKQDLNMRK